MGFFCEGDAEEEYYKIEVGALKPSEFTEHSLYNDESFVGIKVRTQQSVLHGLCFQVLSSRASLMRLGIDLQ